VAGIAAGVVVGVIALAAICAGLFFLIRRRRRQAAEDEYSRSTQVNDFMRGGERKPPQTGYSHMSDSRLDPEAATRRNSSGSIADAADHSRRILRVSHCRYSWFDHYFSSCR
jgi:cell wall integrity and stress response component